MKKKIILVIFACLFTLDVVNAEACDLERQVIVNNAAGSVTASASPLDYTYTDEDTENGEIYEATAYMGMLYVYNLTEDIYAIVSDGTDKQTIYYDPENPGVSAISTGGMGSVKNYVVSIYPTNKNCGKSSIRDLNVTVPRLNRFYSYDTCSEYPDYFYCSQFMITNDITEEEFANGVAEYAKTHKSKSEENRKEGVLEETTKFLKNHLAIIVIVLVILIGSGGTFIYLRNKKRKEQIV